MTDAPAVQQDIVVENFTDVSKISKRVRKVNDIVIPLRRGLGQDQIIAGFFALILTAIVFFSLVRPILSLFSFSPSWAFYVAFFLLPVILVGQKVGAPMPNGKTISGFVTSLVRFYVDDPVHRRGVPQAKAPTRGRRLHYAREWVPSDGYAPSAAVSTSAADSEFTYTGRADLQTWMAERSVAHREAQVVQEKAKKASRMEQQTSRLTATDTSVTFDFED